ncbi:hypothetical protein SAMN05428960_1042 [Mitsuaria sp. PDC51]|uniref:phosphoribosyltransferase-like protein n=1 Tax=Mitsuaria sp. PDC51 TaxID=1881035 RepID=UPI0008E2B2DF|nr:hypothetical protein [Mitsuaria sp. PDC51]SFR74942.1 hypothetical protein SAMN05428960_1042 [Mitsuaria sp. PDC51]
MKAPNAVETTESAQQWLGQFPLGDKALATELLRALRLVSRDEFADGLRAHILERAEAVHGTVALYAERELGSRLGIPHRLFKETTGRRKRAIGAMGPPPVKSTKAYDASVGSEGLVAQLISQLVKEHPKKFLDHPGPERIRKAKVKEFWVVTDLVGSGYRIRSYLEAAWRVRSVRSWWSGELLKFGVVAYASTEKGERLIDAHSTKARVTHVHPAPTIDTEFSIGKALQMKRLCEAYAPAVYGDGKAPPWGGGTGNPLGFGSLGTLIVFAHGAPNTSPSFLHKASRSASRPWTPLFPSRVTASLGSDAFGQALTPERVLRRLEKLGQQRLARSRVVKSELSAWEVLQMLAALASPPRANDRVLATRSGFDVSKVRRLCRLLGEYGWIDSQRRMTDAGAGQLKHARKQWTESIQEADFQPRSVKILPYYPKSLRHPV